MTDQPPVVVITGAGRGIGAATARLLARRGWQVLAIDLAADDPSLPYPLASRAQLDRLAAEAAAETGRTSIEVAVADVRDQAALTELIHSAQARWGRLDAAIAAAGVIAGGVPSWQLPEAQSRAVIEVNLNGVINLANAAVPVLLAQPEPRAGRFIAVASAAATRGLPMLAAYCAAKAGVAGFVRALAVELGQSGITANAVSPGSTATDILDESARLYGLASAIEFAQQQPMHRLLEPAEVAALIGFLAGPDSSGLTGAVIPVDGGLGL